MGLKQKYQEIKQKTKNFVAATVLTGTALTPNASLAQNTISDDTPDKYKTEITVVNDSVIMRQSVQGYYSQEKKQLFVTKDQISPEDFGFKNHSKEIPLELILIHEHKHETDFKENKVNTHDMSLYQNYQRDVHVEIVPKIAEALEIRNQYRNAKTSEAKEAVLKRFENEEDHAKYIQGIRLGVFNPDSEKESDFYNEMRFIKENATKLRTSPDDGYRENFENMSIGYLTTKNLTKNDENFKKEVDSMYIIGGIDFSKIGEHKYYVSSNSKIETAEKMLEQGVSIEKISKFISSENDDLFNIANKLDVSGLSREQAEKVVQTAIISSQLTESVSECLALNEEVSFNYKYLAHSLKEPTAMYLDIQSDIWKKNNILTEKGDEKKFAQLMEQAKTIKLNPKIWYESVRRIIRSDAGGGHDAIMKRIKELDGKIVNTDNVLADKENVILPLEGTSVQEVMNKIHKREKEDADFFEEYNKTKKESPRSKHKYSKQYKLTILDMNSSFLKDELQSRQQKEQDKKFEPLYMEQTLMPQIENAGRYFSNPKYKSAEIKNIQNEKGDSIKTSSINGKPHGLYTITDKYGNIKQQKLYDQGKEIDLNNHTVEIKNETKKGITHNYILLDGKKFGMETYSDNKGNNRVAFWDRNGNSIDATKETQINYIYQNTTYERAKLREELKAQKGEQPKGRLSHVQDLKFDKGFQRHQQRKEEKTTSNKKENISTKAQTNINLNAFGGKEI